MEILSNETLRYGAYVVGSMASAGGWNCIIGGSANRILFTEGVVISALSICCGKMISKVVVYSVPRLEGWVIALPSETRPLFMVLFESFAGVFPACGVSQLSAWGVTQLPSSWGSIQHFKFLPKPFNLGYAIVACFAGSLFTGSMMHVMADACRLSRAERSSQQITDNFVANSQS